MLKNVEDKVKPRKVEMFGKSKRFKEVKKNGPDNFPGPGNYDLIAKWREKAPPGKKPEAKDPHWMYRLTKGCHSARSIYY